MRAAGACAAGACAGAERAIHSALASHVREPPGDLCVRLFPPASARLRGSRCALRDGTQEALRCLLKNSGL